MRQRSSGLTSHPRSTLQRALSTYVVASEGIAAGVIIQALEREGLNVEARWGSLDTLTKPDALRLDLLVVVEPDDRPFSEDQYVAIRSSLPRATIAVICPADRPRPQALIWAGADGIIFEPGADAVIGPAVRTLLAGYVSIPRSLRAGLQPPPLTRRERQMLELVVEGLTNREIAERLYLAESTVKRHLSSTFRRLGVSSRREAAAAVLAAEQSFGVGRRPGSAD
jgi:DNA-binding CsgD family transcriptional regulator